MRAFFTGGSGKTGKQVVPYLAAQGHRVMNVDKVPLNHPGVHDLIADITDAGQIHSAMRARGLRRDGDGQRRASAPTT